MANTGNKNNRYTDVLIQLLQEILVEDDLEHALAGALEILAQALKCDAGVLWLLDRKTDRLVPVFQTGPFDLSNTSIELGTDLESYVTRTGEQIVLSGMLPDERFAGSILEDFGYKVENMICVPLGNLTEVLGCLQLVNKKDSTSFSEEEIQLCTRIAAVSALTIDEKGLQVDAGEKKEVLISARNIIKEFPSGEGVSRVLKGINLDIYKGEFLVILGESGCGKSTLVNIIAGMDNMTDGTLLVEGEDFSRPTDKQLTDFRREYVGFVFQSYNLMPNLTALENVQFIADIAPDPMRAADAIAKVGLTERANNYPSALSGGQQQRVSIARAIVKQPKIVFADEPTAALDYQTSIEVLQVFENIVNTRGTTVVMITHNPEIAKMANRVIKLKNGLVGSVKLNIRPAKAVELVW